MSTGEYFIARPPLDESEHLTMEGEVRSDIAVVKVKLEISADNEDALIDALLEAMCEREIPPEECVGLFGFSRGYAPRYRNWAFEPRLGPLVAVVWHPQAIIPPCTVLQSDAIIYGAIGANKLEN